MTMIVLRLLSLLGLKSLSHRHFSPRPPNPMFFRGRGRGVAGFVDSGAKTLVPSASNRSTPAWTPVDSRHGEPTMSDFALARPEVELGARTDAGRPARGHGLELGVEAHAFHAVDAVVAEHRGLPAAEAVIGDRHRDRHVDADHADLDVAGEGAGSVAVAGEDRRAVAVGMVVHQLDRVVERLAAHHR